jgi:hypothetical protein
MVLLPVCVQFAAELQGLAGGILWEFDESFLCFLGQILI